MNRWDIERKGEEKWERRKGKRQGEGNRKEMLYESKRKGNILGRARERKGKRKVTGTCHCQYYISTATGEFFYFILPVIS